MRLRGTPGAWLALAVVVSAAHAVSHPEQEQCSGQACRGASNVEDHVSALQVRAGLARQYEIATHNASQQAARANQHEAHKDAHADAAEPLKHPKDVAELTGVKMNTAEDLDILISGIITAVVMLAGCIGTFLILRKRYPLMYSNNVLNERAPITPKDTWFGWLEASYYMTADEAAGSVGLDNALQLEFCNMCMRILMRIGVPLIFILCPLHYLFGNGEARNNGDFLGSFGMSNVAISHPWMYYVHAVMVWYVSQMVQRTVYSAQREFLKRRTQWLKELPCPRANTVLVEGIPDDYQSDEKVREFFAQIFANDQITAVSVVKHTEALENLVNVRSAAALSKRKAEVDLAKNGPSEATQASIDSWAETIRRLDDEITTERNSVLSQSQEVGGVNCSSAFVTFMTRRDAELAKELMYTPDDHEWVVSIPPEPSAIRWADFRQNRHMERLYSIVGYAGLVGLYLGFMPICVCITNVSYAIQLPGALNEFWKSLAPTMGLTLFLSFLPTLMLLLFRDCFNLKADPWAQQRLQVWYFWFQVVFVICVTAVGDDVVDLAKDVATSPFSVFQLLAAQLPKATHFYMNYLVLQWSTDAMNLLRYFPLIKYLAAKQIWTEEEARQLAEPEDQDYYGMGSRSARLAIVMLIGLIFSTLSPLIAFFAWCTMALCRAWYGYLIIFAETKKPDLGGAFWATMLEHVQVGNIIYCILMTGVVAERAPNDIPVVMGAAALLYTIWSYVHYLHAFHWEKLAFCEITKSGDDGIQSVDTNESYVQPVLLAK